MSIIKPLQYNTLDRGLHRAMVYEWTGTDDMIADVLTKAILGNKFKKFKIHLMGHTSATGISEYY